MNSELQQLSHLFAKLYREGGSSKMKCRDVKVSNMDDLNKLK